MGDNPHSVSKSGPWFQRLQPARGGTAQRKIFLLANWSHLIHPGPSSSRSIFFNGVESVVRGNADSLLN